MTQRWLSVVAIGALGSLLGCPQVLGIKDGKPRATGAGGSASGGSGGTASGGAGGAGVGGAGGGTSCAATAQTPWVRVFGDASSAQQANDVALLPDGRIAVIGTYAGAIAGEGPASSVSDAFLLRLDEMGTVDGVTSFVGTAIDTGITLGAADDGSLFVAGLFQTDISFGSLSLFTGDFDGYLARYDPDFTPAWAQPLVVASTVANSSPFRDLTVEGTGVLAVGQFQGSVSYGGNMESTTNAAGFLLRAATDGNSGTLISIHSVTGTSAALNSLASQPGSAVLVGAFDEDVGSDNGNCSDTGSGGLDGLVAWVTPSGLQACRAIGGAGTDGAISVALDSLGNAYVAGFYEDAFTIDGVGCPGVDNFSLFVLKFDDTHTAVQAICGSGTATAGVATVAVDAADNLFIAGRFDSGTMSFGGPELLNGDNTTDGYVVLLDSQGQHLSTRHLTSPSGNVFVQRIAADACGSAVVVGRADGDSVNVDGHDPVTLAGNGDAFVARFTP